MKVKKTFIWIISLAFAISIVYSSCKRDATETLSKSDYSAEEYFSGLVFTNGPVAQRIPEYQDIQAIVGAISDGESSRRAAAFESQLISEIRERNPGYFEKFKGDILSKDPVRIDKALLEASNKVNEATLVKGVIASTNSVEAKEYVEKAINVNREKFEGLLKDVRRGKIDKQSLQVALQNIFPDSDIRKLLVYSKNGDNVGPDCLCLDVVFAVNVGILVNLAIAINIGVETNVNIHLNINYHTNIQVDVELAMGNRLAPALSQDRNSLKREQLIASIIKNI